VNIDADDFKKNIEQALEEQLGLRLNESNEIPLTELFPDEFMQLYTEYSSIEDFFDASPWDVEGQDDFEAIPDDDFDEYVDEHTDFPNWEVMYQTAGKQFFERKFN